MAARPATAAQKAERELQDLQLVMRARNGDSGALDALIRRYTGFVRLKASSYFLAGGDSEDLDVESPDEAVAQIRAAVREADAVFFATPEYNSSIPGGLKNALDWLSRPSLEESALRNKPVAVVGASTGAFGAVWAQADLRKVLAAIGARVVEGEVAVGHAPTRFDEKGRLEDESLREQLQETLDALLAEVEARALVPA